MVQITQDNVLEGFVGPEHAGGLKIALWLINQIPFDVLANVGPAIARETALGPLFNPSLYTSGRRFRNGEEWSNLFRALAKLRSILPDRPAESADG